MGDKSKYLELSTEKFLEAYKKYSPYLLVLIVILAILWVMTSPVKVVPPDTLKFVTYETGDILCDRILAANITNTPTEFEGYTIRKVGLVTEPNYDIYLRYQKSIYGDYYLELIRCDPNLAYFPIDCTIYAPEGDSDTKRFTDAEQVLMYRYTGKTPEYISVECIPIRVTK